MTTEVSEKTEVNGIELPELHPMSYNHGTNSWICTAKVILKAIVGHLAATVVRFDLIKYSWLHAYSFWRCITNITSVCLYFLRCSETTCIISDLTRDTCTFAIQPTFYGYMLNFSKSRIIELFMHAGAHHKKDYSIVSQFLVSTLLILPGSDL